MRSSGTDKDDSVVTDNDASQRDSTTLTADDLRDFADTLGTWTLDLTLPSDLGPRWGHLSTESCDQVATCLATWLAYRALSTIRR